MCEDCVPKQKRHGYRDLAFPTPSMPRPVTPSFCTDLLGACTVPGLARGPGQAAHGQRGSCSSVG